MKPFSIEVGPDNATVLNAIGQWTSRHSREWERRGEGELCLSYVHGWDASGGLEFLTGLQGVRRLVVQADKPCDFSPVSTVTDVQELLLSSIAKRTHGCVDFEGLRSLRKCDIETRIASEGLYACDSMEELDIVGNRRCKTLEEVTGLGSLRSLRLDSDSSLVSLDGVQALQHLEELTLMGCRNLCSIEAIATASGLKSLWIEKCRKVDDVSAVRGLRSLSRLVLGHLGDLPTVEPVGGLKALEVLCFFDTNILDGDLSGIAALPNLRGLSLQLRKHYRPQLESFG